MRTAFELPALAKWLGPSGGCAATANLSNPARKLAQRLLPANERTDLLVRATFGPSQSGSCVTADHRERGSIAAGVVERAQNEVVEPVAEVVAGVADHAPRVVFALAFAAVVVVRQIEERTGLPTS